MKNLGFIESSPTPTDYIAGVQSGIVYSIVNPSGFWENYLPSLEAQNSVYMDTMACVSFSANNCVETYLNYLIAHGGIAQWKIDWLRAKGYFDENGKINLSDRYLAKVSGTTKEGNTFQKVGDAFRHFGAVPESKWNYPREQRTPVFVWEDYYAETPQELYGLGQEFLTVIGDVQYEWVTVDVEKHLKQAPLQLAIHLCPGWNTGTVPSCGALPSQHAIEMYGKDNAATHIFDTYNPFKKTLASDYSIPFIFKIIINQRETMFELIRRNNDEDVYYVEEVIDVNGIKSKGRVHIGDGTTFEEFKGKLWGDMNTVKVITDEEFNAIPKTGVLIRTKSN